MSWTPWLLVGVLVVFVAITTVLARLVLAFYERVLKR